LSVALVFGQGVEKCPAVKNIVIKRVHHVVIPINVPYPVYKELPVDGAPIKECPEHFKRTGDKCIHVVKTIDVCPVQYSRISDTECIRVIVIDKPEHHSTKCPDGYIYDKAEGCVSHHVIPIRCPKGYRQVGKFRCKKVLGCPHGSRKVGRSCVHHIKCKKGELVVMNTCIRTSRCPFGYENVDGVCEKGRKHKPKEPKECNTRLGENTIIHGFNTIRKTSCRGKAAKHMSSSFEHIVRKGQKVCSNGSKTILNGFRIMLEKCSKESKGRSILKGFNTLLKDVLNQTITL